MQRMRFPGHLTSRRTPGIPTKPGIPASPLITCPNSTSPSVRSLVIDTRTCRIGPAEAGLHLQAETLVLPASSRVGIAAAPAKWCREPPLYPARFCLLHPATPVWQVRQAGAPTFGRMNLV